MIFLILIVSEYMRKNLQSFPFLSGMTIKYFDFMKNPISSFPYAKNTPHILNVFIKVDPIY